MSVLAVLGARAARGADRSTYELVRHADPARFRVQVCAAGPVPAELAASLAALGAPVQSCRPGPRFALDFARLVRKLRPDVVHAQLGGPSAAALAIARALGVPRRVLHLRTVPGSNHRPGHGRSRTVALHGSATAVLAVSETAMRVLWRPDWRVDPRCRVVYKGLEVERYGVAIAARRRGLDLARGLALDEPVTLLHVGAPGGAGNRLRAVGVLAELRSRKVDATLRFVGPPVRDGADADAPLLLAAAARGVVDEIEFVGEQPELARTLVASSLLLFTALPHEGLPTVVLEACAVGTPVLAAEMPGVTEIARLLPGVTTLPLSASDGGWADKARLLTDEVPSLDDRREALRAFVRSPFNVTAWHRAVSAAWLP